MKSTNPIVTCEGLRERIGHVPQVNLGHFPTPLEDCTRLSDKLGGPRILIKREDCSGLAFGGNKVRQLTFTIGEAVHLGADTIVHGAASQSNHCRQAAAACARLGLKCYLRLSRDHKSIVQGNLLLDHLSGANVEVVDVPFGDELHEFKEALAEELKASGLKPYVVGGAHSTALAAVGFTWCMTEIYQQQRTMGVDADWIYVSSAGGTQAGLVLGSKALGMKIKPFGIAPLRWDNRIERIQQAGNAAAEILNLDLVMDDDDVRNTDAFVGKGYGMLTPECAEAIRIVAQTEGIFLDPVYSGKAMAGLIDHVRKERLTSDDTVVFLHTGGTPQLFVYNEELCA
ncbi:MAG: D-cysteine desulfhydrase family protein [Candidatus Poribacteria bacterium]|nr:D-cysteine desulfhydrase family protein [Candidatus Poribacteria bacterium]MDE0506869.1 D-cysteine desulfhydrase family protein [Candidatus Poribacteria bacterium]